MVSPSRSLQKKALPEDHTASHTHSFVNRAPQSGIVLMLVETSRM